MGNNNDNNMIIISKLVWLALVATPSAKFVYFKYLADLHYTCIHVMGNRFASYEI